MGIETIAFEYQGREERRDFSGSDIEIAKKKRAAYEADPAYRSYVDSVLRNQARERGVGFSYTNPGNFRSTLRPIPIRAVPQRGEW